MTPAPEGSAMAAALPRTPTYRWIPLALLALLGVVVAVNIYFVVEAKRSWTGLVAERPFEEGTAYNRVLAQARAQDALGWKAAATLEGGRLRFALSSAVGTPIAGMAVTARLERPVDPIPPVEIALAPEAGGYGAAVELPRRGQWQLRITAARGGLVYQHSQRVVVP
ncbi:MAG TPA: FixH family protein [Alphaproteobacteria bacterium]|nr:FixH family protein [Alphaproteobacteria bacterium]